VKILVACELPQSALDELAPLASELCYRPNLTAYQLRDCLADVGILVVGAVRVSPEAIAAGRALQMIVHAGCGPGEIAVERASTAGVFVTHCPDQHAQAVAELTLGLILALDRRIVENTIALKDGRWIRSELADARGLAGRTIGIMGYGAIGRSVARLAQAFQMRVLTWSPRLMPPDMPEPLVEACSRPRDLARQSDVVTLHADESEPELIVDAAFLEAMGDGAYLVSLGPLAAVDEEALFRAVERGRLRLALDVSGPRAGADSTRFRCRLCDLPGVIGTQHMGALTEQARQATAREVVRIVRSFVVCGEVLNCLNLCERSPATWQLVLRVRDQMGVMAAVMDAIRADGVNAQEITSKVFTGAKAVWCAIALDERPSAEALASIRNLPDVLHLELRAVV